MKLLTVNFFSRILTILFDYWNRNQRPRGIYWIKTLSAHSVREHDSSQFLEISRIQPIAFQYLRIL